MADNTTPQTPGPSAVGINSPALGKDGVVHTPAITSIEQAVELVKSLDYENNERAKKNSRILSKYNSERPFEPQKLKDEGLSWRSNFSTKPLASLVDRVVPRFVTGIENVKYLTASKLPDTVENASGKTEAFREGLTKLCRSRDGWKDFITELAQENVLFGYCGVGWTSRYEWFPRCFTQDNFLVPQGTKHTAGTAQVVAFRETFLLHELFELIRDREPAELAGWDVDNCIVALNEAMPDNRRSGFSDTSRIFNDLYRESSILASYTGAKVVSVWHLFVSEVDGQVTHVAYDQQSKKKLFWKDKQFPSMAHAASFFSFQHGNGKLHSSKGVGRELYALAGVLDRGRNEVVDRLILSGKLVLNCDEKEIKRFQMSVVGSAILIGDAYKVAQSKIDGGVESYFELDRFLSDIIDDVVGSVSPKAISGDRVTKAQIELNAGREEEKRDSLMERFLSQFAKMMTTLQRRACDPDCIEKDAKAFQEQMLKIMSPEELAELAGQPAVTAVKDYTDEQRAHIVQIAAEAKGNPLYNAREIEKRKLTAVMGPEFAESVLLPDNDPTEQAEQTRQQQMEMALLQQGQPVPVSPRDNHLLHLGVLHDGISAVLEALHTSPGAEIVAKSLAEHAGQHIQLAEQAGMSAAVAPYKQLITALAAGLEKMAQEAPIQQPPGSAGPEQPQAGPADSAGAPQDPEAESKAREAHDRNLVTMYKNAPEEIRRQIETILGLQAPANPTPVAKPTADT